MSADPGESFEDEVIAETKGRLAKMEDRSLQDFFEGCDQFCKAAIRRGEQPPTSFVHRRELALEEMNRRLTRSTS